MRKNRNWFEQEGVSYIILFSLLLLIAAARIFQMWDYPLFNPSEGRYAEIARNMAISHNWITPQINPGVPFWGKPPLLFWMVSLSYSVFGFNEFGARVPSFILECGTAYLTFLLGKSLRGTRFGIYSALVLASSLLFYIMAGTVLTDSVLTFCITLSLVSIALAIKKNTSAGYKIGGYFFFVGLGLGVLAKGLIGLVFTFVPIALCVALFAEWRKSMKSLPWVRGSLLFLFIAVPWHLFAEFATPGFLDYYLIGEHFKRFLVPGWHGDLYGSAHSRPLGMFLVYMTVDTLPWNVFVAFALVWLSRRKIDWPALRRNVWLVYLLIWFLTPVFFFTASHNVMFTYALPILPPFAILTVMVLQRVQQRMGMQWQPFRLRHSTEDGVWFLKGQVLAMCILLIPALTVGGCYFFRSLFNKHFALKMLVEKYRIEDQSKNEPLYFIGNLGFTLSFYSQGKSIEVDDPSGALILSHLYDKDIDFYILREQDQKRILPDFLLKTEEIDRIDPYVLRRDFS